MNKSTKKIVFILFIALMAVVMTACGKDSANKDGDKSGEGLKIAIVTSPSGVDDGNFNEDNYNGILSFIEKNPTATVKDVKEPTGDPAAAVQAVADIVADYDVIVTPGFQFAGVSSIAVDNPDKIFIINDSEPAPVDGQTEFDNIYAMNFAEQESGFFAGIAAALETKTNKVAVVNGIAYPSNVNYQFGFESGVNYANKMYGKNVEIVELSGYAGTDVTGADVGGNYAGSFADEETGKVIGNALINQGVDIIFVAAGGTGNGVFTAVKEAKDDVKVIGVDVDQYEDGANGSENIVLTSAVKFMAMNIEKALNSVVDGTFKGGNVVLYADTDSTGFIKEEGHHQLSEDTLSKLNEAYELVKDGTIVPASNFNEHSPEDFPGL
ncbi:BMP family lipoprotein [Lederbergia graminis]|uniref:BMP family protein n=1 Tax=Lederbergia graminis TaxID=735518 RepID=A0ABW0LE56_9BACI